jgi:hypothetical protein
MVQFIVLPWSCYDGLNLGRCCCLSFDGWIILASQGFEIVEVL